MPVQALVDSSSQITAVSEKFYKYVVIHRKVTELAVSNVVPFTAIGKNRVEWFDQVFFLIFTYQVKLLWKMIICWLIELLLIINIIQLLLLGLIYWNWLLNLVDGIWINLKVIKDSDDIIYIQVIEKNVGKRGITSGDSGTNPYQYRKLFLLTKTRWVLHTKSIKWRSFQSGRDRRRDLWIY